jgi:hypothetical protein
MPITFKHNSKSGKNYPCNTSNGLIHICDYYKNKDKDKQSKNL